MPASTSWLRFKAAPNGNAKNGMSKVVPGAKNLRISESALPRINPIRIGMIAAINAVIGIFAKPVAPKAIMVKKGPSLKAIIDVAPTSVASPYSPASAAYRPPFLLSEEMINQNTQDGTNANFGYEQNNTLVD